MKYIKYINELFKTTYYNAADKLQYSHPKRAEKLRNWAKMGEEPMIDKEHWYKFNFEDYKIRHYQLKEYLIGDFYITGYSMIRDAFIISFESNSNRKITILINHRYTKFHELEINMIVKEYNERFFFQKRKDALQFYRYIKEVSGDVRGDVIKNKDFDWLNNIRINQLYNEFNS